MKRVSPGGSSRVLSKVLAVMWFMRSAGKINTTLPRAPALVVWLNESMSRMASTRISRLGLRFLSSMSLRDFSGNGHCSSIMSTSGMRTIKSAWARTAMPWQLGHTPHAPCSVGAWHNQAAANDKPSSYCPNPDGPCNNKAWPGRGISNSSWACSQGANGFMRR